LGHHVSRAITTLILGGGTYCPGTGLQRVPAHRAIHRRCTRCRDEGRSAPSRRTGWTGTERIAGVKLRGSGLESCVYWTMTSSSFCVLSIIAIWASSKSKTWPRVCRYGS